MATQLMAVEPTSRPPETTTLPANPHSIPLPPAYVNTRAAPFSFCSPAVLPFPHVPARGHLPNSIMKTATSLAVIGLLLFVGLTSAFYFRDNINNLLADNERDQPTHDAGVDSSQKSSGKTANPGADFSDKMQSGVPKDIDGSLLVIEGIRQTINPKFRAYTADQLYKIYSTPVDQPTKGTLIFFDYDNDGIMDYVATNIGDEEASM